MATTWEPVLQLLPMADQRDFHRPGWSTWRGFAPDSAAADDSEKPTSSDKPEAPTPDNSLKFIQQFLKTKPLGISYEGPTDGYTSPALVDALTQLQTAAETKDIHLTLTPPSLASINQLVKALQEKEGAHPDESIQAFQKIFGQEPTGQVTDQLIQAAQGAERTIAEKIHDSSVIGMIWDPNSKQFKTSPGDVATALGLLK